MSSSIHVPFRTRVLAHVWAWLWRVRFYRSWHKPSFFEDTWYSHQGLDLNLYIEDGTLTVTAYRVWRYPEDGTEWTDTDKYTTIIQRSKK